MTRTRPARRETRSRHWPVVAVAVAGFAAAINLAAAKIMGRSAFFCAAGDACGLVHATRYAVFLGLPTAAWGAAVYGVIAGLALGGLTKRRWLTAFLLATVAATGSAYLTYLALFVIGAACTYCVVSAGIAWALVTVLLWNSPRLAGR